MAMTGSDIRDGLALDRLELRIGPFFPPLPPGLVLDLVLQGDVIQEAATVAPPFPQPIPEPLVRALRESVPRGRVHEARARLLLRRAARVLGAAGAGALAYRALALSHAAAPTPAAVRRLRRLLRRGGTLTALPGAGSGDDVGVARQLDGWLDAAAAALAGDRDEGPRSEGRVGPIEALEDLGPPFSGDGPGQSADRLDRVVDSLPGAEWGVAVLRLVAADPVPIHLPEGPEDGGPP